MRVSILLCLLICLTACGTTKVVEKPVLVETVRTEFRAVPGDLLVIAHKTTIPETLTYGEAMLLWSADRAIIDVQNGQIEAIESLNEPASHFTE